MGILSNPTSAGVFKHRVTIHPRTTTVNSTSGENVQADATTYPHWGFVTPLTAKELVNAQQLYSDVTHLVKLRYDSLTSTMTHLDAIEYPPGHILEIEGLIDKEAAHIELWAYCREAQT